MMKVAGKEVSFEIIEKSPSRVKFKLAGKEYSFARKGNQILNLKAPIAFSPSQWVDRRGHREVLWRNQMAIIENPMQSQVSTTEEGMTAPMPGKIFKIMAKEGERLKAGDKILILEAMKMEHAIKAPRDGKLDKIFFKEGEQVEGGAVLAQMEQGSESESS